MAIDTLYDWRLLYAKAHFLDFEKRYPLALKDGHYCDPKYPAVAKANGLTTMIINFLNWNGHRATRINTMGRKVGEGIVVTESGARFREDKWIKSSTRKGTADISATINGRSVMLEIKAGKDRPSPDQLKEQERERKAGGIYEFIFNPDEFFCLYYSLVKSSTFTLGFE